MLPKVITVTIGGIIIIWGLISILLGYMGPWLPMIDATGKKVGRRPLYNAGPLQEQEEEKARKVLIHGIITLAIGAINAFLGLLWLYA